MILTALGMTCVSVYVVFWSKERPATKAVAGFLGFVGAYILLMPSGHEPAAGFHSYGGTSSVNEGLPFEHRKVRVVNTIVKAVNGKYRYFFDIRNYDKVPFEGEVAIEILGKSGVLKSATFHTLRPLPPGLGTFQYAELHTGPPSIHGEYGVNRFRYMVKIGEQTVAVNYGSISSRIEDLNTIGTGY